jgi:hypothetical protein
MKLSKEINSKELNDLNKSNKINSSKNPRNFKSNSTSSIFLSSTINSPNVKIIIKAVATILQSQLIEDMQLGKTISSSSDLFYFSEEKYIQENPNCFDEQKIELINKTPSYEEINDFIEALYYCAQFSPECCVLCLIYINRIIALTGISLQSTNWRPMVLVSLMISQKVWDDKYLSNADFAYIYPFFDSRQLNILEIKFLEMIQYNVFVKASLYFKYYLELKSVYPEEFLMKPMDIFTMNKLENQSRNYEEIIKKNSRTSEGLLKNSGELTKIIIN